MDKIKYKVVDSIKKKGFPTSSKYYLSAHKDANKIEKKHDAKEYKAMKKVDSKFKKNELAAKNTQKGKIIVSRKVPKKFRAEVAKYHEQVENKKIKKLEKENH